jgi:hypothetical protein
MTREAIIDRLKAAGVALGDRYPIASMALFGPVARNEHTDNSDVDVVVSFNSRVGMEFIYLAEDLEAMLGRKVDLVSRNGIKPKYFEAIKQDMLYVWTR